jgi:protein-S-isoprenylcysteine O-methyltransferase Ste14
VFFFLIPLVLGFSFNVLSASTAEFSRMFGNRRGSFMTVIFRDILGIPVWVIGFCLAALAPAPYLIERAPGIEIAGWILIAAGAAIIFTALTTIRLPSLAPSTGDALARTGIYARVRHPIHSGTVLEFLGLFLVRPIATLGVACALGVIWVMIQTICEERDLLQRMPGYREYMNRVPRFLPKIR